MTVPDVSALHYGQEYPAQKEYSSDAQKPGQGEAAFRPHAVDAREDSWFERCRGLNRIQLFADQGVEAALIREPTCEIRIACRLLERVAKNGVLSIRTIVPVCAQ